MILDHFDPLERALVAKGFPPSSPWWRRTIERFYRTDVRQLVCRVGRRGGKSSTIARVAVLEALYGEHTILPGDVGIVGIVSVSRDEANARLRTIKAILEALRVSYKEVGETIELRDRPIVFKVFAASLAGVVGGTWICAICDEVSRWLDRATGANPATEVLGSLRPTLATMPSARIFLISSPLGTDDAHAKAFDLGETAFQQVTHAPSWVANPTLSEARLRAEEPEERIFLREYAAIPQNTFTEGFFTDLVDACIDAYRDGTTLVPHDGQRIVTIDPATRRDEWALAVTSAQLAEIGQPRIIVERVTGWRGTPAIPLSVESTVAKCSEIARAAGVSTIYTDQASADALRPMFDDHAIDLIDLPWTAQNKASRFTAVRLAMLDRRLRLPNDPETLRQFRSIGVRLLPSGIETFEGARGVADDRVHAIVMAAFLAEHDGSIGWNRALRSTDRASRLLAQAVAVSFPRIHEGSASGFDTNLGHERYDASELSLPDFSRWHPDAD